MSRVVALSMLAVALLAAPALCAGTTITTSEGSVLTGTVDSGLPEAVTVTSDAGDVSTIQISNIESMSFGSRSRVTILTFDGNTILGRLEGPNDVIEIRTESGDAHTVQLHSIVEIRFALDSDENVAQQEPEQEVASETAAAPEPLSEEGTSPLVASVVDVLRAYAGSLTLGLDSGFQAGYSIRDGFELPRLSIGVNALQLGLVGRAYFPVSISRVRRNAARLVEEGVADFGVLLEKAKQAAARFIIPYFQLGTDALIVPHVGDGLLIRLSSQLYIDVGATVSLARRTWISIGVVYFFPSPGAHEQRPEAPPETGD